MLSWVLNMCHHQFLCNMMSCVQIEVQAFATNLKIELLRPLTMTIDHDVTFRCSRSPSRSGVGVSKPPFCITVRVSNFFFS